MNVFVLYVLIVFVSYFVYEICVSSSLPLSSTFSLLLMLPFHSLFFLSPAYALYFSVIAFVSKNSEICVSVLNETALWEINVLAGAYIYLQSLHKLLVLRDINQILGECDNLWTTVVSVGYLWSFVRTYFYRVFNFSLKSRAELLTL